MIEKLTESAEIGTANSSTQSRGSNEQSLDENPIRQVIGTVHETEVVTGKETSNKINSRERESVGIEGVQSVPKEEIKSHHSDSTIENASERKVRLLFVSIPFDESFWCNLLPIQQRTFSYCFTVLEMDDIYVSCYCCNS